MTYILHVDTIGKTYHEKEISMSKSSYIRMSGIAGIVAGVSLVAGTILALNPNPELVWI